MGSLRTFRTLFLVASLTTPCWADLPPGTLQWNPQLPSQPAYFSTSVPAWVLNPPAAAVSNAIFPPGVGTAFVGTVESAVYYRNGVDASGGLAFTYRFTLDDSYVGDTLKRAIFFPDYWDTVDIDGMGADGSGLSTPNVPDPLPPGTTFWSDGSPYRLDIDTAAESPDIRWSGPLGGTVIGAGDSSSLIWFETTATTWTDTGIVTLLDTAIGGGAYILVPLPEPGSALLMLVGGAVCARIRRRKVSAE